MLGLMQRPKLIRLCLVDEDGQTPHYLVVLDKTYAIRTKACVEIRCVRERYSVQLEGAFEHKHDGSALRVADHSRTLYFLMDCIRDGQELATNHRNRNRFDSQRQSAPLRPFYHSLPHAPRPLTP